MLAQVKCKINYVDEIKLRAHLEANAETRSIVCDPAHR